MLVGESPQEKREFLRRFVDKIVVEERELRLEYFIPHGAVLGRRKSAENGNAPTAGLEVTAVVGAWLPALDTYRTFLMMPPPDVQGRLESIHRQEWAA